MAIKVSLGKLKFEQPYELFIPQQLTINGIGILNLSLEHTAAISTLPFHHKDPFDRVIAVQANLEKMCVVSADSALDAYGVERVW